MRILLSLGAIVVTIAIVSGGTVAFLSDTESSTANVFAAGAIDLKIDNESYYNGALNDGTSWQLADLSDGNGPSTDGQYLFFDFRDVKPDDEGEDTISIHVDDNDAWACLDISVTSADDNGCNEPEALDGDLSCGNPGLDEGELQNEIAFVWWPDDGDNVLEADEATNVFFESSLADMNLSVVLADATGDGILSAGPLLGSETYYVGKAWCFGTMTLDPMAQDGQGKTGSNGPLDRGTGITCDGTGLDNTTQTDSVTGDITFRAVQSRHNEAYTCNAVDVPCEIVETYADEIVSVEQGLRKDTSAVAPDRSVPSYALGVPQSLGTPYDNPVAPNSFFALGFPLEGRAAEIVLSFNDNAVVNGPGNDLKLWEVTGGSNYPDEQVDVYVGDTPTGPWTQVGFGVTRDAELELGLVDEARYVRIVDASNLGLFEATADGYDLDAVQALNCVVREAF